MSRRIESQVVGFNCHPEKVYEFIGNFDNFTSLLPSQVANWQSTGDYCSFEVKGLATLGLRITTKTPFSNISMKAEGKLPFGFTLDTFVQETAPQQCQVQLILDADMNPFIAKMVENPIQNYLDMLLPMLKQELEKE
ncbi:MAG: hypothetical protein WCR72_07845 [Bacteroidota bacterium]